MSTEYEAYVKAIVDAAPPFSERQKTRLRAIFGGTHPGGGAGTGPGPTHPGPSHPAPSNPTKRRAA